MGVTGTNYGTATKGQRPLSAISSDRQVDQYLQQFIDITPDEAPLTAMMDKLGMKLNVKGASYFHLETDKSPLWVTLNDSGGISDSDTSATVTAGHGNRVRVGDVLYVEYTQEYIYVSAVSTDTLTITRGYGGSTAAAVADGTEIRILNNTHADGGGAIDGVSGEPTRQLNYCQILKEACDLSGRAMATQVYGPNEWDRNWQDCLERHERKKEQTWLFGRLKNSLPYMTGGLQYWVTTNVRNAGGTLDEGLWNAWLRDCIRRNGGQMKNCVIFMGEAVRAAVTGWMRERVENRPDDKVGGISCREYQTESGETVKLHNHALLGPLGSSVSAANMGWQGFAFFVNGKRTGLVNFRPLKRQTNIETPGTDGRKDGLLEDSGLFVGNEQAFGILKNVAA